MPNVAQVTSYRTNRKMLLCTILQFECLKWDSEKEFHIRVTVAPKKSYRILWEITTCFLNIFSLIIQNWMDMGCQTFFLGSLNDTCLFEVRKVRTHFSKNHDRGGAWWQFFFWRIQRIIAFTGLIYFGFLQFLTQTRKCMR